MKTLIKILIFTVSLIYPYYGYCETDSYLDSEEHKDFVETSKESIGNEEIKEEKKSKTEKNRHQYDIEIYPYVSVKYTSTTIVEEGV